MFEESTRELSFGHDRIGHDRVMIREGAKAGYTKYSNLAPEVVKSRVNPKNLGKELYYKVIQVIPCEVRSDLPKSFALRIGTQ